MAFPKKGDKPVKSGKGKPMPFGKGGKVKGGKC
jgi:hypothetical protein